MMRGPVSDPAWPVVEMDAQRSLGHEFGGSVLEQASLAYTMLGDYEAALDGLETLLGIPSAVSIPWLRLDPRWAPPRDQPKYLELEKRFGEGSSIP